MRAIKTASTNRFRKDTNVNIPINTWVHVAVTFDGTNVRTYKDGVLLDTYSSYLGEGISPDGGCLTF